MISGESIIKRLFSALLVILCVLVFFYGVFTTFFGYDETQITPTSKNSDVSVHFIDVGQGDCTLVQIKDKNIIIDAGEPDSRDSIISYLNNLGITEFEYAIFTHPHSDHIGVASEVIGNFDVKNVIMPSAVSNFWLYDDLLKAIEIERCNVIKGEAGKSFVVDDAVIELFAPDSYYHTYDLNDMSVVAKLTYGETSFLFTGDAEKFSESQMLKNGYDLSADVLKVAHHGSSSSNCESFLKAVKPSIAVVSAEKDNEYGHPHYEVRELIDKIGAEMYITYEVGSVIVSTDGKTINVTTVE